MRSTSTRTSLLAVMAAALTLAPAAGALAATGGVESGLATAGPRISHRASLATWFGPGFYGRRTACGQVLTPAIVGLANRKLPCGTLVTVTYRGRRLTMPVIDRGPYGGNGAQWDLTAAAARALGLTDTPPNAPP